MAGLDRERGLCSHHPALRAAIHPPAGHSLAPCFVQLHHYRHPAAGRHCARRQHRGCCFADSHARFHSVQSHRDHLSGDTTRNALLSDMLPFRFFRIQLYQAAASQWQNVRLTPAAFWLAGGNAQGSRTVSASVDLVLSSAGSIDPDAPLGSQGLQSPPAVFCWYIRMRLHECSSRPPSAQSYAHAHMKIRTDALQHEL